MVIRRQAISLRRSDFHLDAAQILSAAEPRDKRQRQTILKQLQSGCDVQRHKRSIWIPFLDGVLLCRALGLAGDVQQLLSLAPAELSVPVDKSNYILEHLQRSRGLRRQQTQEAIPNKLEWQPCEFSFLDVGGRNIAYHLVERYINATKLGQLYDISRGSIRQFFLNHPHITKKVRFGKPQRLAGTYISHEDAYTLCAHFSVSDHPVQWIELATAAAPLDNDANISNCVADEEDKVGSYFTEPSYENGSFLAPMTPSEIDSM